jgi:CDP-4-dehydro-6-deoxyglucose reductase, E1
MKYPLIRNSFDREDLDSVIKLLREDDPRLTNGPRVAEFEKRWSEWLGVKYSVFVNSGSSANLLSMVVLKQKFPEGGEVIVPSLTWVSDISSVLQTGFTPVFVDVDMTTLGMNEDLIISSIKESTRAVFISHIQGFNALSDRLISVLAQKNITLIEDVCESHGATHNSKRLGSLGWISSFSFYYAHHMSTIEGGMVCTDDEEVYRSLRMLRSHGLVREIGDSGKEKLWHETHPDLNPQFIFAFPSYNMRNNEIGGVLGLSQLSKLDCMIEARNENHKYFIDKIRKDLFFINFKMQGSSNYAFNLIQNYADPEYSARLMRSLELNGIEFRRGSAGGGNQLRQPYIQTYLANRQNYKDFPVTDHIHFYGYYIGNFPQLEKQDIDFIVKVINAV